MLATFLDGRVVVKVGDITDEAVDAIVNAANASLLGGGGVDGAIHRRGGPTILQQCRDIRDREYPHGLPTGQAVITTGGELPAKHVIHTVGPVSTHGGVRDKVLLAACYTNSLTLADSQGLKTLAFPSISTGAFGYAKDEAAAVSSAAIKAFLGTVDTIAEVRLVFFSQTDADIFLEHHDF